MEHVIRAEGLKKRFGETQALAGVDILARQGTVLGVLGPNGAGKTTAVRTLATLIKPDEGHAEVCGYDVVKDAARVRRLISLTGQYASVDEELTGVENIIMVARLVGHSRAESKRRARELLDRFELSEAGGRAAKTYSGGMRRRLDLAVGLVNDPQVIYLDEPTTGLDPRARNAVWDTVRGLVTDGATVLLTTQHLDEAEALADQIVVFDRGRVVADGTAEELKEKIGGQTLAVRAMDRARTPEVAEVVARITGGQPEVDLDTGLVTAPLDDPATLTVVVRGLDEANIVASELALRRPSLDEVFLSLTGHPAESEGQEQ